MSKRNDKEDKTVFYQNIRKGVNSKARFEPLDKDVKSIIDDTNKDWYKSLFYYTEEHKKFLEKNGTVSGIRDTATNCIYFDFDDKNDLNKAKEDAVTVAHRLIENGFPEDSIVSHFTGSKGFSLEVSLTERS